MIKDFEEKAIDLITDFCEKEYGNLEYTELEDLSKIQIIYTTYEKNELQNINEDLDICVFVDLRGLKIWVEYNNINVYEEVYGSQKDMLEQLESLDFQAWTNLDELEKYLEMKGMI